MSHSDGDGYSYANTFTCGFTNGDTYTSNADGNCDSDSHTDCYSNGYIHCNTGSNCNCHSNCDTNAKRDDSTGASDSNPTRSAYSRTAPVASIDKKKHTAQCSYEKIYKPN